MIASCDGSSDASAHDTPWHVGASVGYSRSQLHFSNGENATLHESAVSASLEYHASPRWTYSVGVGAIVGGDFSLGTVSATLRPGAAISVGAAYMLVSPTKSSPFVLGTLSFAAAFASTRDDATQETHALRSSDARVGVVAGMVFGPLAPFAFARAFGGPVQWTYNGDTVVGGDRYHVQLGVGLSAQLGKGLDLFVEAAPLGERRIAGGAGISF